MTTKKHNQHHIFLALSLLVIFLLTTLVLVLGLFSLEKKDTLHLDNTQSKVAQAFDVESFASDSVIHFYEKEIAKKAVVSHLPQKEIKHLCSLYEINEKRLFLILVLKDLSHRVDHDKTLRQLAQLDDNQLFSCGKTLVLSYISTLSDEEKDALKNGFLHALKG